MMMILMKRRFTRLAAMLLFLSGGHALFAQWQEVAPGIDYQAFERPGPLRLFVVRADRSQTNWTIDTMIGRGSLAEGVETVSDMVHRYDGSVDSAGHRREIQVAINGDYFNMTAGHSTSGQIIDGWFVRRYLDYSGGSGFVWTADRRCFLGGNVRNLKDHQCIFLPDGKDLPLMHLNTTEPGDGLALHTWHYADRLTAREGGIEVVLRVPDPVGVCLGGNTLATEVVAVNSPAQGLRLAFDEVALSAAGDTAQRLLRSVRAGDRVRLCLGLKDYGTEGVPAGRWDRACAGLGGHFYCVVAGRVPVEMWEPKGKPGAILRHPRTAVGFNDHHVFFLVADGRSAKSVGMTITELGRFCADELAVSHAVAQDGGGSSTMWVGGRVMNDPSDGRERPVANGYFMALVHPPERSGRLKPGERPAAREDTRLRCGPGACYHPVDRVSEGAAARILHHRLNGIRAGDDNWWHCESGAARGWLPERELAAVASAP